MSVFLMVLVLLLNGNTGSADVEMTGFKIIQETVSGRWEIQAQRAYYDDLGDVVLQDVSARMIKGGVQGVTVSSDEGRYETTELVLHLEGNVSVSSVWGYSFEAPVLRWEAPRAVMVAENGVRIVRGPLVVQGDTVRYRPDSGTALVDGDVRTTWRERSKNP